MKKQIRILDDVLEKRYMGLFFNYFILFFKKIFFNIKIYLFFLISFIILFLALRIINDIGIEPQVVISGVFIALFIFINYYIFTTIYLKFKRLFFKKEKEDKFIFYFAISTVIILINIFFLIIFFLFIKVFFETGFLENNTQSLYKYKNFKVNIPISLYCLFLILMFSYSLFFLLSKIMSNKNFNIVFVSIFILMLAYWFTTIFVFNDMFFQYLGINNKEVLYYQSYQFYDVSSNTIYYSIIVSDDYIKSFRVLKILLTLNPFYFLYLIFQNSIFTIQISNITNLTYQGIKFNEIPQTQLQFFPLFYSNFSNFKYDSWMIIMWLPYIYSGLFLLLIYLNRKIKNKKINF
ncbi:MAG: hypothetical protein HPAVJP_3050 [Candidatus Hepatoplasma vulgare]|nr:MAG: hypothetical protein HPAVJP_3050 [Candidatus Hepatoplasma sp.]